MRRIQKIRLESQIFGLLSFFIFFGGGLLTYILKQSYDVNNTIPLIRATKTPTSQPLLLLKETSTTESPIVQENYNYKGTYDEILSPLNTLALEIYHLETREELTKNVNRWREKLESLLQYQTTEKSIDGYPIVGSLNCGLVRSAIELKSTYFVTVYLGIGKCLKDNNLIIKCTEGEKNEDENPCKFDIFQNRVAFEFTHPITSSDYIKITYQEPTKQPNELRVPIEKLPLPPRPEMTDRNEPNIHLCTQGILYPELVYGAMPQEHFDLFISHYSRLGVKNFHFYTNDEYLDRFSLFKPPQGVKLWIHETRVPKLKVSIGDFTSVEAGYQHYVINECVIRSRQMGSVATVIVDLDEFIFPNLGNLGKTFVAISPSEISIFDHNKEEEEYEFTGKVIWLPSYIFHTVYCSNDKEGKPPNWYHNFINHFTVAKMDGATYKGRRKSIFIFNSLPIENLVMKYFYQVHDLTVVDAVLKEVQSRAFHIHHYREHWHSNVCGKNTKDEFPDISWTHHVGCGDHLKPIEI